MFSAPDGREAWRLVSAPVGREDVRLEVPVSSSFVEADWVVLSLTVSGVRGAICPAWSIVMAC